MNKRIYKLFAVLAAALLILALSVPAFAAGGSTTVTAEVTHEETIVVPVEPRSPHSPQTGDGSHIVLWTAVALGSLLASGLLIKRGKMKDEEA